MLDFVYNVSKFFKPNDDNMFKALLVLMCEELECLMNDKMNC